MTLRAREDSARSINPPLIVLAFASFAFGTQTFVLAGLLDRVAVDLSVTVGTAGQLASVFAIVYAVSAPVMAGLAAPYNRKRILTGALVALFVLNVVAAFMPDFGSLLTFRILSGLASALVMPVAAAAAATLAPPDRRGRALAVVLGGIVGSFLIGIPIGTVIGDAFGWRATFIFSGILALAAAVSTGTVLPVVPNADRAGLKSLSIAFDRPVLTYLVLTLAAFTATFSVIAFVGPVVTAISGLEGNGIGLMQSFIGIGMIIGVVIGGIAADRSRSSRVIAGAMVFIALTQAGYSVLMTRGGGAGTLTNIAGLVAVILIGAAALFTLSPLIQARLVEAAPTRFTIVLAMNASMIFLGQGLGTVIGGLTAEAFGLMAVGFAGAVIAALGTVLAFIARRDEPQAIAK